MSEPGRAPQTPVRGFQTEYSKRLKAKLYKPDVLKKITTPTKFKSPKPTRTKLRTQLEHIHVSTEPDIATTLTIPNTGVNNTTQEEPPVKNYIERPSGDRQGVAEAAKPAIVPVEGENPRKVSIAGSDESLEFYDSQEDNANSLKSKEHEESVKQLINDLEKSDDSINSSSDSSKMDTTVVDTENKKREPGEKSPTSDKFISEYVTTNTGEQYKTLSLPDNVISNLLDFKTNDLNIHSSQNTLTPTGGVGLAQSDGGLSSFRFGLNPTPPNSILGATVNLSEIQLKDQGAVNFV